MSEWNTCTFCGNDAYREEVVAKGFGRQAGGNFAIACRYCEVCGPGAATFEAAIAAWNTRADTQAQIDAAVRDALERAADIAHWGAMVPPDGGSPSDGECAVADYIEKAIRAIIPPPP